VSALREENPASFIYRCTRHRSPCSAGKLTCLLYARAARRLCAPSSARCFRCFGYVATEAVSPASCLAVIHTSTVTAERRFACLHKLKTEGQQDLQEMINEVGGKVDFQQFSHVRWVQSLHLPSLCVCVAIPGFSLPMTAARMESVCHELMLKDGECVTRSLAERSHVMMTCLSQASLYPVVLRSFTHKPPCLPPRARSSLPSNI
jgi:hypothetical protein